MNAERFTLALVRNDPGMTFDELRDKCVAHGAARGIAYQVITYLEHDGKLETRHDGYARRYWIAGTAPVCQHNRTDAAIGAVEPTSLCKECGATRKHSATTWSHWTDAIRGR